MVVRNQALPFRDAQHMQEKSLRHFFAEQAFAAGAEGRLVPNRLIKVDADKTAVQQVIFDVLQWLGLGADREQGLDKAGAKQAPGRWRDDRDASTVPENRRSYWLGWRQPEFAIYTVDV